MRLILLFFFVLGFTLPSASAKPHRHKPAHRAILSAPLADHPRLLITSADLPRLQSWAVQTNPWWNDLTTLVGDAKAKMDANGIVPADNGSYSISAVDTEEYAELFAFMSLVDPDPAKRADWAQRAHDLIMVPLAANALGEVSTSPFTPFRDPRFATDDRSRWVGEAWGLTVDWVYQTFSAVEKETILSVFTRWCKEQTNTGYADAAYPTPIGILNDPRLTSTHTRVRWSANNYYNARARNTALMAACLDAADDPSDLLRTPYLANFWGAWMYVVAYGETHDYAGSVSPEGTQYGITAQGNTALTVAILQHAGLADPAVYGAQTGLLDTPFWTNFPAAITANLSPNAKLITPLDPGPSYSIGEYGDVQQYDTHDPIIAMGALAMHARETGNAALLNACRYIELNMQTGGPGYLHKRNRAAFAIANPTTAILLFMLFDPSDPNSASPTDPRPGYPLDFVSTGLTRIMSRTDWGPNAAWVIMHAPWNEINHQAACAGKVEFWRKGEWLTMGRPGYGMYHDATDNQNSLSLQSRFVANWPYDVDGRHGSQWLEVADGNPRATPANVYSLNPAYTYLQTEMTQLYRSVYAQAQDVTQANRSVMWLKPDFVLVYDRAKSSQPGQFKREEWNTVPLATVAGNVATETLASGQRLTITSVLPAGATLTAYDPGDLTSPLVPAGDAQTGGLKGEQENGTPVHYRVRIEDAANPQAVRFLTVLQGVDSGAAATVPVAFASTSGNAFDGALIGDTAILFIQEPGDAFAGMTFQYPAAAKTCYVTGLTPGAGYTASANNGVVAVTPGGALLADSGGVLTLAPPSSPPPAPTGLTATAGNAQVSLSWDAVAGATGYNVNRAGVAGGPYACVAANVQTSNYTDSGLTNGSPCFYTVTALNASGESAASVEATATPVAPPPPSPSMTLYFGLQSSTAKPNTSVTATVLLSAVAPVGGIVVALASSSASAVPPASVTVPAGQRSINVSIPTGPAGTATITATLGQQSIARKLTVQ